MNKYLVAFMLCIAHSHVFYAMHQSQNLADLLIETPCTAFPHGMGVLTEDSYSKVYISFDGNMFSEILSSGEISRASVNQEICEWNKKDKNSSRLVTSTRDLSYNIEPVDGQGRYLVDYFFCLSLEQVNAIKQLRKSLCNIVVWNNKQRCDVDRLALTEESLPAQCHKLNVVFLSTVMTLQELSEKLQEKTAECEQLQGENTVLLANNALLEHSKIVQKVAEEISKPEEYSTFNIFSIGCMSLQALIILYLLKFRT